jgi:ABC-type uncharacterized transport system substrate-binding protein
LSRKCGSLDGLLQGKLFLSLTASINDRRKKYKYFTFIRNNGRKITVCPLR